MISLDRYLSLLTPKSIKALATWPVFSVSSYEIIKQLYTLKINPTCIIDVGANVGQFASAARGFFPDAVLYAYEPQPDCFKDLSRAFGQVPGVFLRQTALGENTGTLTFNINSHRHSSSALPLAAAHREAFPSAIEQSEIQVPITTLDVEFGSGALTGEILLKLDVQGFEAAVLRGGSDTLKSVRWILLETSFEPMYEGEMIFTELQELVAQSGFKFLRPVGWLSNPETGQIVQMDALFVREDN
jgi:FkbM family methyltransferase